jgi:hypothetical protein
MTRKALWIIFGAVLSLAFVLTVPTARADEWDQASKLTFNQPVEIPGNMVLPTGSYWFVLSRDAVSEPNLVKIFNADRTHLIATIQSVPTSRMETTDHDQLTFAKQAKGQPVALLSWFYADRQTGHEFIYPSREEAKLSENEQITVMGQNAPLA